MAEVILTDAAAVYCPFYISETPTCIICEGLLDCMDCVHRFREVEEKNDWMRRICSSALYGEMCAAAVTLNMLYEEDAPAAVQCVRHFSREEKRVRDRRRKNRRKKQRTAAAGPRAARAPEEKQA